MISDSDFLSINEKDKYVLKYFSDIRYCRMAWQILVDKLFVNDNSSITKRPYFDNKDGYRREISNLVSAAEMKDPSYLNT